MRGKRALLTAAALVPLLSGCVAAALPVMAAGGMLGTRLGSHRDRPATTAAPQVSVAAAEAAAIPTSGALPPAGPSSAGLAPAIGAGAIKPSDGTPAPGIASFPGGGTAAYDLFYDYAAHEGTLPVAGSERMSAMLADPGALEPVTRECSVHPAAVLVDLDPAGGTLDPDAAVQADRLLAGALAALRAQEITVAWISASTADRAGAIRRALVASGLDPAGRDELALLRYPGERKQTRREDFAKEFCVVAIAGDDRGDFDELFQYLKDKSLAAPLDGLIGKGWFLVPPPLVPQPPVPQPLS